MNNNGKIIVQWVTPTGNTVLQQLEVPFMGANKDRLPLKAIREKVCSIYYILAQSVSRCRSHIRQKRTF
jgi:hypothetical protein